MDYPVLAFEPVKGLRERLRTLPGLVLQQEGLVNDLSTLVNRLRRERDYGVSDVIDLVVACEEELWWSIHFNESHLLDSTKANSITFVDSYERDLFTESELAYGTLVAFHTCRADIFWWSDNDDYARHYGPI